MSGDSDYLEPLMVNRGNLPEKEKDQNKSDVGFFLLRVV
jgi:hypothetical protein